MCWRYFIVVGVCFVLVCFDFFGYYGYDLAFLSMFTGEWICKSKRFDVVVCFCMLCSLLDIITNHLWVHFSKSTLLLPDPM